MQCIAANVTCTGFLASDRQRVAVCCNECVCVAVCRSVLQYVAANVTCTRALTSDWQCDCSVLQRVVQCVAVCCSCSKRDVHKSSHT